MIYIIRPKNRNIIIAAAIIIITLGIYWPGLQGPLLLDDGPQLKPILNGLDSNNWAVQYKEYLLSTSGILKRPVSMGSFILNAIFSGQNIWHWKLTNVLLHILCGFSIFILTRLVISLDNSISERRNIILSVTIAGAWLVHPLQVSTVLYLVQRMTIFSALFTTCAMSCYFYALKKELNNKNGAKVLLTSSLFFFLLALLSKENAALFPIYILLSTIYILIITPIEFKKLPKKIKLYNYIMVAVIAVGFIILAIQNNTLVINGYNTRTFTLYERMLTESRVVLMYLFQILTPFPSTMGFFHDDFIISKNLFTPYTTFTSIALILSIIIYTIIKVKNFPLLAYGLLFFFSSHLLESSIFPLEIAFEHRNYIGIWGIILSSASVFKHIKKCIIVIFAPVLLTFSLLTFNRTEIWGDSNVMYPYMLSIHPQSKRLHTIFANAHTSNGNYDKALEYLENSGGLGALLQQLSIVCERDKRLDPSAILNTLDSSFKINIGTYEMEGIITLSNLGLDNHCFFSKQDFIQFLSTIPKIASLRNNDAQKIFIYLAHYHHEFGNFNQAIQALNVSFSKNKKNPIPLFLMVEWFIENSQINDAKKTFKEAKYIADNSIYDYSNFIDKIEKMLHLSRLNYNN